MYQTPASTLYLVGAATCCGGRQSPDSKGAELGREGAGEAVASPSSRQIAMSRRYSTPGQVIFSAAS
jgi:hypothetical protein